MNCLLFAILSVTIIFFVKIQCLECKMYTTQELHGPVVRLFDRNGAPKESWAYVTVRPKAHMFYWLYHTTHAVGYQHRPLIMWLQGGPGGSSTGFGNFEELGPLDTKLKQRNTTWIKEASVLFVDNPVGAGFSYVEDDSSYTKNINDITADLLVLIKAFIKSHNDFQKVPFYIFSESYGGKMAAAFSAVLNKAIKNQEVMMNFKGFAMGDSWISPVDSVLSWGPYLHATSIVSEKGLIAIKEGAKQCEQFLAQGKFAQATNAWSELENTVDDFSSSVNFYNIMEFGEEYQPEKLNTSTSRVSDRLFERHVKVMLSDDLSGLMNKQIRKQLGIIPDNVQWGAQSAEVFKYQISDFMKNVTTTVNDLINDSILKVVVYSGQLDLICDVLGTEAWFSRLDVSKAFYTVVKKRTYSCGQKKSVCYFGSKYKNVEFYWILNAGHMVPADNGPAALSMVSQIIG